MSCAIHAPPFVPSWCAHVRCKDRGFSARSTVRQCHDQVYQWQNWSADSLTHLMCSLYSKITVFCSAFILHKIHYILHIIAWSLIVALVHMNYTAVLHFEVFGGPLPFAQLPTMDTDLNHTPLTFWILLVTWCTNQFNIQQWYALPTLYLFVLYLSENKQRLVPLTA